MWTAEPNPERDGRRDTSQNDLERVAHVQSTAL